MRIRIELVGPMCILGLMLLAGCGGDGNKVSISGTVEMDGKPLGEATLGFVSENGSSLSSASTDPTGKFYAKVAPGKTKVSVSKVDPAATPQQSLSDEQALSPTDAELAVMRAKPKPKTGVPARFADPNASGLSYDIKPGMEPLSISITSN